MSDNTPTITTTEDNLPRQNYFVIFKYGASTDGTATISGTSKEHALSIITELFNQPQYTYFQVVDMFDVKDIPRKVDVEDLDTESLMSKPKSNLN